MLSVKVVISLALQGSSFCNTTIELDVQGQTNVFLDGFLEAESSYKQRQAVTFLLASIHGLASRIEIL